MFEETKESWKGTLELKPWKQYTQFIRFQWGGANPENAQMKLEIHYGEYVSTLTNETFAENPLLMNYFKIPDGQFALLDKENGFDMYIIFALMIVSALTAVVTLRTSKNADKFK